MSQAIVHNEITVTVDTAGSWQLKDQNGNDAHVVHANPDHTLTWKPGDASTLTLDFGGSHPFESVPTTGGVVHQVQRGKKGKYKYDITMVDSSGQSKRLDPHVIVDT